MRQSMYFKYSQLSYNTCMQFMIKILKQLKKIVFWTWNEIKIIYIYIRYVKKQFWISNSLLKWIMLKNWGMTVDIDFTI